MNENEMCFIHYNYYIVSCLVFKNIMSDAFIRVEGNFGVCVCVCQRVTGSQAKNPCRRSFASVVFIFTFYEECIILIFM